MGEKLSNIVLLHHFWGIDLFCSEMTGHKNVVPGGNGTLHVHHIKKRTSSKKKSYAIKRINFEKPFLQDQGMTDSLDLVVNLVCWSPYLFSKSNESVIQGSDPAHLPADPAHLPAHPPATLTSTL